MLKASIRRAALTLLIAHQTRHHLPQWHLLAFPTLHRFKKVNNKVAINLSSRLKVVIKANLLKEVAQAH